MAESEGKKYDDGKLPLQLLPVPALEAVGEVLKHGARKYSEWNWIKGMKWSRLYGAALRHLFSRVKGEKVDEESHLPHLAHATCCLLFLLTYELYSIGEDDLGMPETEVEA